MERDPLVAALARYVEALHRRYPDGPEQMRRERLAAAPDRANVMSRRDREAGRHEEPRAPRRLPRSLDDVRGLRVARWIRESTAGQYDRYGPASQREQQDRFIERHGLVDTGLVYQVAHSGTHRLALGHHDRDARRRPGPGRSTCSSPGTRTAGSATCAGRSSSSRTSLHPNGVALVMCDRRILSSDPPDWDELISEAAGAEKYSRRLSERITEGYAAKFDQEHDPGGHAGLGFRRLPEPPHTLEVDPDTHRRSRSACSSGTPSAT